MMNVLMAKRTQTLGQLIRERRLRARMTQQQLAESLHVTREAVSSMENDRTEQPSVTLINRLARILPVSTNEIVMAMGVALESDVELTQRMLAVEDDMKNVFRRYFGDDASEAPGTK